MKKYFVLISIFALTACSMGGGSGSAGGGGVYTRTRIAESYTTPSDVRSANYSVTQMETLTSSADAIVALVSNAGVDLTSAISRTSPRLATHRSAVDSMVAGMNDAFETDGTAIQQLAMDELKNLYTMANLTDSSWDDLAVDHQADNELLANVKRAFILAGNDADDFPEGNAINSASLAVVRSSIESSDLLGKLDKYVTKNGGEYTWTPKINTLEEVDFMMAGEDSKLVFTLDGSGIIKSVVKYDHKNDSWVPSEEKTLYRNANGKDFVNTLTKYSYKNSFNNTDVPDFISQQFNDALSFTYDSDVVLSSDEIEAMLVSKLVNKMAKIKASQTGEGADTRKSQCDDALVNYTNQIGAALDAYNLEKDETKFWTASDPIEVSVVIDGVKNGLKFADLGVAALTRYEESENTTSTLYAPYVGGYESRKVDAEHITDGTKFTGTVVAGVDLKDDFTDTEAGMLLRQDNAVLTMNHDGSSSLVMNNLVATDDDNKGKQWYNVKIDTTSAGVPTFTIDDKGKTNFANDFALNTLSEVENQNYNQLEVDFSVSGSSYDDIENRYTINGNPDANNISTNYGGSVEVNTYGATPTIATEATSRFGFSENQHDAQNKQREVAIYGAFGGRK